MKILIIISDFPPPPSSYCRPANKHLSALGCLPSRLRPEPLVQKPKSLGGLVALRFINNASPLVIGIVKEVSKLGARTKSENVDEFLKHKVVVSEAVPIQIK